MKQLASWAVKLCVRNVLIVMIISCKIYFVFSIFMVYENHKNIFTTKISRSLVFFVPMVPTEPIDPPPLPTGAVTADLTELHRLQLA